MNKFTFPLKQQMQGPDVDNLQDALELLLDRGLILSRHECARCELATALQRESAEQIYGEATCKAVNVFQEEQRPERGSTV
jgi:hypothetical protein